MLIQTRFKSVLEMVNDLLWRAIIILSFLTQLFEKQAFAIKLVRTSDVRRIFMDGSFSKNHIFMSLLSNAFPEREFYAAEVAKALPNGAAIAAMGIGTKSRCPEIWWK